MSQGLRNREWTTDLPILGMEDVDATIDFVDTFDYSVAPDVDTVITSNVALLNDTDDTAVVLDYQLREGYIVVDTPVTVRWGASSEGALLVDLGLCGGELKRVVAIASAVGLEYTNSVYLPTGIHYIRMHNVDNAGSNSSWVPQSSNNGIDFVADNDVLDDLSSTTQPSNECLTVKICETSGETYNFITDEAVDVSTLKTCPISCGAADATVDSCLTPTGDVLCHDAGKARQYISCEDNSYTYLDTVTGEEVDAEDLVSCEGEYNNFIDQTLCEIDAEYLLLIDSGGKFGRYSFYTGEWTLVDTLSVRSAGGSADVDNFLLYNFVAPDQLTVIDVNTDTQLPNVTLIDGVINPAAATNPKTFSAGAFRKDDGKMYAWDTAGADVGLYSVDVVSGEVDFITTVSGVVGAGTSIMVDNFSDTLYINGSLGRIYEVDWVTGVGTQWGQAPIGANGATFDESGNAYVSGGNDTYKLPAGLDPMDELNWVPIITDFVYGANSVAYYRVEAAKPSCFNRRYGVNPDGTRELIGDFNVADDSVRTVVGDIDCCSSGGSSSDTGGGISDVFVQNFPASQTVDGEVNIGNWPTETDVPLITEVGVDTNVPAGFKSVTIVSTSGETTINGLYVLGEGRLPSSQSFGTDRGNYINEILPAYTLAGGTWQWIGHK